MDKPSVRVLIVDDSAVVRQTLRDVLSSDPEIEVIAVAADPIVAAERIREPRSLNLCAELPDWINNTAACAAAPPLPLAGEGWGGGLSAGEHVR